MHKNENRKGRALIYARFSPRRDAEDCKSCEWQCAECEQYAANHHIPLQVVALRAGKDHTRIIE